MLALIMAYLLQLGNDFIHWILKAGNTLCNNGILAQLPGLRIHAIAVTCPTVTGERSPYGFWADVMAGLSAAACGLDLLYDRSQ